jgi:hypothetical protein
MSKTKASSKKRMPKRRPVKPQEPALPEFNIHHPDIATHVEFAFECNEIAYYRFKDGEFKMPVGRHKFVEAYLAQTELRMDLKTLTGYLDQIDKYLNSGQLAKVAVASYAIRSRCNMGFEPETIERLASVVYFDETEDLSDYNPNYGTQKIEMWKKHDFMGFFLTRPIEELCSLKGISEESLRSYITQIEVSKKIIADLMEDPQPNSSPTV